MNTSARNRLQSMKAPMKLEKEKAEMQGSKPNVAKNRQISSRERKMALQQDVDNLKKQLRHEENIHRALERAFSRPLGALPRLPPYLPRATLELVAEVAVLEEEVVQLEEQIVYFRQDMYQEAVYISSSKRNTGSFSDLYNFDQDKNSKPEQLKSQNLDKSATSMIRHLPSLSNGTGKENAFSTANSIMNNKGSSIHKAQRSKHVFKRPAVNNGSAEKKLDSPKLQTSIVESCLRQLAEPQSSGETCVLDKYLQFLHDECFQTVPSPNPNGMVSSIKQLICRFFEMMVRVYTAAQVEDELEVAKREYLQAAIRITTKKFAIPKLLDWYLLDFAKDLESLLDWISLQLPCELGGKAINCQKRGKKEPRSQFVQVMPYVFSFRYLLFIN
ncbi:hypothetical protein SADUNF_Sadunf02G0109100 [Salix dunnii]|uniref:Ternary complex factor MIP1 leucine-zipper domain-containing protein n=1 Tax=Salix dunnii TaxID=1413687 RepID=A0A835N7I6_9ROSI|nr:hypothetical protein SADUNF_Sadunf02G0109100 [Salix dunnii]